MGVRSAASLPSNLSDASETDRFSLVLCSIAHVKSSPLDLMKVCCSGVRSGSLRARTPIWS